MIVLLNDRFNFNGYKKQWKGAKLLSEFVSIRLQPFILIISYS